MCTNYNWGEEEYEESGEPYSTGIGVTGVCQEDKFNHIQLFGYMKVHRESICVVPFEVLSEEPCGKLHLKRG